MIARVPSHDADAKSALMPGWDRIPRDVRTEYLGQYTPRHAAAIAERLDEHGIVWWWKEPGFLSRVWEHGVRLFVDRSRIAEARAIARAVTSRAR